MFIHLFVFSFLHRSSPIYINIQYRFFFMYGPKVTASRSQNRSASDFLRLLRAHKMSIWKNMPHWYYYLGCYSLKSKENMCAKKAKNMAVFDFFPLHQSKDLLQPAPFASQGVPIMRASAPWHLRPLLLPKSKIWTKYLLLKCKC